MCNAVHGARLHSRGLAWPCVSENSQTWHLVPAKPGLLEALAVPTATTERSFITAEAHELLHLPA